MTDARSINEQMVRLVIALTPIAVHEMVIAIPLTPEDILNRSLTGITFDCVAVARLACALR
jgi:hypothetical protein